MLLRCLLFLYCFVFSLQLLAQDTLVLSTEKGIKHLKSFMSFYRDSSDSKTLEDMLTTKFKKVNDDLDYFNFNFQHHPFWFKVYIKNATALPISQYFEINRAYFPVADLYMLDGEGDMQLVKSGSRVPFRDRPVNFNTIAFDIKLNPSETKAYYLHINTGGLSLVFRPQLYEQQKLFKSNWSLNLYYGSYFGVLLIVLINSLFLYYVERRTEFMFYFGMVLSVLIVNSFYSGYLLRVIQNFPFINDHYRIYALSAFTSTITGCLFSVKFLSMKEKLPKWRKFFLGICVLSAICFIGTIALPHYYFVRPSFYITVITAFLVSIVAVLAYRKGDKTARFFIFGYLMLSLGILVYGLRVFNLIPENNLTIHAFEFGSMLEMIFLFLALADKQSLLKKKYEAIQRKKIESSEESKQALMNLVHDQTGILTQSEMQIAEQNAKVQQLEGKIDEYKHFEGDVSMNALLNKMIYSNLKLRLARTDALLSQYPRAFTFYKSKSKAGNAFVFSTTTNKSTYIIVGENELSKHVSPIFNIITRAYFSNVIINDFNASSSEVLRQLNYYYKEQMQEADLDEALELRIGVLKICNNEMEFASAGQLLFLVNKSEVEVLGDNSILLGNNELPRDYNFITNKIDIEINKGAFIYLVGWGVLNSVGGFSKDVYGDKRVADLLKNLNTIPAEDQKQRLGDILNNWLMQGGTQQINDWVVLGFELN